PGALSELQLMNEIRMLIKAYQLAEQGRRSDARSLARLGRDAAPSGPWAVVAQVCNSGRALAHSPVLRGLRQLGFPAGRPLAARRPPRPPRRPRPSPGVQPPVPRALANVRLSG